jgi:nucleotide-binding universal stress UspA family protein
MDPAKPPLTLPAFREPAAAQAGGYVLALACLLVAVGLVFHPPPSGGFEEKPSVLEGTPWWAAIHILIAAGFVLCVLGGHRRGHGLLHRRGSH